MPSSLTHDVVATIGEYTDAQGQKKKRYATCGKCFTDEQGRQSIKIDVIPVGTAWSGWLSLYPVEKKEFRQQADPRPAPLNLSVPANRGNPPPDTFGDDDEEIPF